MPAVVKVNNLKKDYILGNVVVAALREFLLKSKKTNQWRLLDRLGAENPP